MSLSEFIPRRRHAHSIVDLSDRLPRAEPCEGPPPAFLLAPQGAPRTRADALDGLARDLDEHVAQSHQEEPLTHVHALHADDETLSMPPLDGVKALLARLTYGDMKELAGDIAKRGEFDAGKLADAMHECATAPGAGA